MTPLPNYEAGTEAYQMEREKIGLQEQHVERKGTRKNMGCLGDSSECGWSLEYTDNEIKLGPSCGYSILS